MKSIRRFAIGLTSLALVGLVSACGTTSTSKERRLPMSRRRRRRLWCKLRRKFRLPHPQPLPPVPLANGRAIQRLPVRVQRLKTPPVAIIASPRQLPLVTRRYSR